jgi:Cytochrome P460
LRPDLADSHAVAKEPATVAAARGPRYDAAGKLRLPTGFETWVFVGSNLGLEYREDDAEAAPKKQPPNPAIKTGNFHNVYIDPEAFRQYEKTGTFPDGTVLILDIYKAISGEPKTIVSEGLFPGAHAGVAAAVKNSKRPDGSRTDWAYYDFSPGEESAAAFPNKACYDCHLQHADDDNVFVQFYPTLRRIRERRAGK